MSGSEQLVMIGGSQSEVKRYPAVWQGVQVR